MSPRRNVHRRQHVIGTFPAAKVMSYGLLFCDLEHRYWSSVVLSGSVLHLVHNLAILLSIDFARSQSVQPGA